MTSEQAKGLEVSDLSGFSSAQIAALKPDALGALTTTQFKAIDAADIAALTTAQMTGLTTELIANMSIDQVVKLGTVDIKALISTQVNAFTADQLASMSLAQIAAINFVKNQSKTVLELAQAKSHADITIDTSSLLTSSSSIVKALDGGSWNKQSITYSYNTSIPSEYSGMPVSSAASGNLTTNWQAPTATIQAITDGIMTSINDVIGATLSKVDSGGDIRFNMLPTASGVAAFAFLPTGGAIAGDLFIDTKINTSASYLANGGYGDMTITHELGHSLGLKHPFEGTVKLPTAQDNQDNTIMSYTNYKQFIPTFTSTKTASGTTVGASFNSKYEDSFMVYDIAALQTKYGVNSNTNTGDDTYSFSDTPIYTTIWDAGGIDTLDFSLTTHSDIIRLTPGSYNDINYRSVATQISDQQVKYKAELGTSYYDSWVATTYNNNAAKIYTGEGALGIAYGVVIENAIGGKGNDSFYDNLANNNLVGGLGDDIFYEGAGGFDTITGGAGTDKVVLSLTKKADVRIEKESTGETLVVANTFAVSLIGVESIQFSDQVYQLV
jgi:hypothetical protein